MARDSRFDAVLAPSRVLTFPSARELWHHRDLLQILVVRDLKVRYRQTFLGVTWALLQPILTMVAFSAFLGRLEELSQRLPRGAPYPLFALAGLVPWVFFANGLGQCTDSVVNSGGILKRVYFPRIVIPLASVLTGLVDLLLGVAVLGALLVGWRWWPGPSLAFLPLALLDLVVTTLAVGIWLSALNAQFRDVRHTLPFMTQLWLFLTPIAYPAELVPSPWRTVYAVNPMVGVLELFRAAALGAPLALDRCTVSLGAAIVLLASGVLYFDRVQRTFADRL